MTKRGRRRLLLGFGGVMAGLLLAEAGARLLGVGRPLYAPRRFEPGGGVPFTQLPNGPVAYQPNVTFSSVYDLAGDVRGYFGPDGRVTYQINEYGMRGPALSPIKPPGTLRVCCLGDSITFGEGVRYQDTYPAMLQMLLSGGMPQRSVEVMNAGVQAYGTDDAAAFFLMRCAPFKPDVVVVGFFLNDAMEFQETIRQNEAAMKELDLSLMADVSRIWEVLEHRRRAGQVQDEYFAAIRSSFKTPRWDRCKEVLNGLREVGNEDGFALICVLFPVLWELDGQYPFDDVHALIGRACRDAGIDFIDLLDVYRGRPADSLWVHPTDHHPNEIAHRLAAERIAGRLLELHPPAR